MILLNPFPSYLSILMSNRRLGQLLVEKGLITPEQLRVALDRQKVTPRNIGQILIDQGLVAPAVIARVAAEQLDLPYVELDKIDIDPTVIALYPRVFALKNLCLPVKIKDGRLLVAMAEPLNLQSVEDLHYFSKCEIERGVAPTDAILRAIERYYPNGNSPFPTIEMLERSVEQLTGKTETSGRTELISFISNKGGVGKTHTAVNIAYGLAKNRKKVLLIDLDLGNADVSNKIGLFPDKTLFDFLNRDSEMDDIIQSTKYGFYFIASKAGEFKLANLIYAQKLRFIRNFLKIAPDYDYVIFDLPAGISRDVIDFALATDRIVVVTTPRDIIAGYACIKASFFRFSQNEERLATAISGYSPNRVLRTSLFINQVETAAQGDHIGRNIQRIATESINKHKPDFSVNLEMLGSMAFNKEQMIEAENKHKPFMELFPRSANSDQIEKVIRAITSIPHRATQSKFKASRFSEIIRQARDDVEIL